MELRAIALLFVFLLNVAGLGFSSSSVAEMKMPGAVIANLCTEKIVIVGHSSHPAQVTPKSVCFARILGDRNTGYLVVDSEVWQISADRMTLQLVGANVQGYFQESLNTGFVTGTLSSNGPELAIIKIKGSEFHAEDFHIVFTTL